MKKKWDLVVYDCSNNTKLLGFKLKRKKVWFGASNYGCEFSRIILEIFLPVLRDENFKFYVKVPEGYRVEN